MKPISRLGVGSLFIIQLVLALLIFISAAYLSANYFKVWDLTKDDDFTLSDLSKKILAKESIAKKKDPIQLIVAFDKSSPYFDRVRRSVDEFVRQSKGQLVARYIDHKREPDAATRFASTYGLTLNLSLIHI